VLCCVKREWRTVGAYLESFSTKGVRQGKFTAYTMVEDAVTGRALSKPVREKRRDGIAGCRQATRRRTLVPMRQTTTRFAEEAVLLESKTRVSQSLGLNISQV
jgi:hypothetical protein